MYDCVQCLIAVMNDGPSWLNVMWYCAYACSCGSLSATSWCVVSSAVSSCRSVVLLVVCSVSWSCDWAALVGSCGNISVMFVTCLSMTVAMKCVLLRVPPGYSVSSLLEPKCRLVMLFEFVFAPLCADTRRLQKEHKEEQVSCKDSLLCGWVAPMILNKVSFVSVRFVGSSFVRLLCRL